LTQCVILRRSTSQIKSQFQSVDQLPNIDVNRPFYWFRLDMIMLRSSSPKHIHFSRRLEETNHTNYDHVSSDTFGDA